MPQPHSALPTLPDQAARLALIDKAITRRLEEARELDARLEIRLDLLTRAESNHQTLLDNLRKNTTDLSPVIALPYLCKPHIWAHPFDALRVP